MPDVKQLTAEEIVRIRSLIAVTKEANNRILRSVALNEAKRDNELLERIEQKLLKTGV
jgi:hypothetical protein